MDKVLLNEIIRRVSSLLPEANGLREELRTKIEQTIRASFQEFNLLTRSDFESQAKALKRAESRITELELLIGELEKRIDIDQSNA